MRLLIKCIISPSHLSVDLEPEKFFSSYFKRELYVHFNKGTLIIGSGDKVSKLT